MFPYDDFSVASDSTILFAKESFKTHRHSNNCFVDYDPVTEMLTYCSMK